MKFVMERYLCETGAEGSSSNAFLSLIKCRDLIYPLLAAFFYII